MKNNFPRLAILSSRFPFPVEKGDKLRLYHQIRYLSDFYDIYLFSLSEAEIPDPDYQEIKQYCQSIFTYVEGKRNREFRVFLKYFDGVPSQVNYFYSKKIGRNMWKDLIMTNPDVVYCQLFRMAPYVEKLPAPKVLDIMDAFGNIAQLQAASSRGISEKIFWSKESQLLKNYEHILKERFSSFTIISERDADELKVINKQDIHIVRNGIDVDYFDSYDGTLPKNRFDISFIGNLEYRPNQEAAYYIANKMYPYFAEMGINLKVLIGGKGAEKLKSKITNDNIYLHGWYDDIREAYYSAPIFVAPIFLGSGMQNKVLEAMACSRDVICSSHVMEAMPMLKGYAKIADTLDDYFNSYMDIRDRSEKNNEQNSPLDVLKETLTWDKQCNNLRKVLEDARKYHKWDIDQYH